MATRREREQRELRYADAKDRAEKHEKAFEPTALNVPAGAKFFRFKRKGLYRLDILPYVAGPGNPFCDEGFLHYERTYYVYRVPTVQGTRLYVDPAKTFNQKSPFPAFIAKMIRSGAITQQQGDEMGPKERQLFNLIDLDAPEQGVQIFEFNHWQFGKLIDSKVEKKEKYKTFFHLKGGYTIEVEVDEEPFNGKTVYKPVGISFEPREDYAKDILDKVYDLDAIPKKMKYEDLEKVLTEGGGDHEEEDEKPGRADSRGVPSGNGHTKPGSDEDDEDEGPDGDEEDSANEAEEAGIVKGSKVKYQKKEWEVIKVSGDGTSLTLEDEDGEQERGVAPGDVQVIAASDDDEDDDEAPPKKKAAKKPAADEEDDEDELDEDDDEFEDEDDDEEEEKKPAARKRGR